MQPITPLRLLLSSLLTVTCLGFPCITATAQSSTETMPDNGPSEVTFHLRYLTRTDPVKITHVLLGDKEIPLDTPIKVEGMWMRNIRVVVQNVTSKPIVRIGVLIEFPETGDGSATKPIQSLPLALGRFPTHAFLQRDGTDKALTDRPQPPEINVSPGSSITLASDDYADSTQIAAYKAAGHISKVDLSLPPIHFSDESKWMAGSYYLAVPPPVVWQQVPATDYLGGTPPDHR